MKQVERKAEMLYMAILLIPALLLGGCSALQVGPSMASDPKEAEQVQKVSPPNPVAEAYNYYSLGLWAEMKGNWEEAADSYQKAVQCQGESVYLRMSLASLYLRMGRWADALPQTEDVLRRDPRNVEAYSLMGSVYASLQNYSKAEESLKKALSLDPEREDLYFLLGGLYGQSKEYEKAISLYRELGRLKPGSPLPSYHLARIYLDRKMLPEARENLMEALSKDASFEDATFALAYSYEMEERYDEAKEVYSGLWSMIRKGLKRTSA